MRERFPTIILRAVIILAAIAGAVMCVFALPPFGTAVAVNFPAYAFFQYPILIGIYAAALCFFFALFQFWLLLNDIDRHGTLTVKNLRAIRISATVFSVLYFVFAMPVIFLAAEANDAPGLVLIGAFMNIFPIGAAAITAVLERIAANNKSKAGEERHDNWRRN